MSSLRWWGHQRPHHWSRPCSLWTPAPAGVAKTHWTLVLWSQPPTLTHLPCDQQLAVCSTDLYPGFCYPWDLPKWTHSSWWQRSICDVWIHMMFLSMWGFQRLAQLWEASWILRIDVLRQNVARLYQNPKSEICGFSGSMVHPWVHRLLATRDFNFL